MKTKDLKELGLTDDQIDAVMKINGQDVNNAKNGALEETKEKDSKITSLEAEVTKLKEEAKQYADYADLKKYKEDAVAAQEKQQKLDFLKSTGCKHPELFIDKVDFTKGKYNAEKKTFEGLDDGVKAVKEQYKEMFEDSAPNKEVTFQALGDGNGKKESTFNQDFRNAFGIK